MAIKREKQGSISEVFQMLGLESAEKRECLSRLAKLGQVTEEPSPRSYEPAETRSNTAVEKRRA